MKAYGHTKTLFIQGGKYKWSYNYDHCIQCKACDHKHKGRGLCVSCFDKDRMKNPRRQEVRKKSSRKFSEKKRIPPELHKKKGPKPTGLYDKKKYKASWYQKWKEALIILNKGRIWSKKGKILPMYKGKPIPFDIGPREKEESYEDYKERMRKFEVVKNFIDK